MITDESGFHYLVTPFVGRTWWIKRRFTFYWIIFGLGFVPSAIIGEYFNLKLETGLDFLIWYLSGVLFLGIFLGLIYYFFYKNKKRSVDAFVFNLQSDGIKIYKNKFVDFVLQYNQIRKISVTQDFAGRKTNSKTLEIIAEGNFTDFLQNPKDRIALFLIGIMVGNLKLISGISGNIQAKKALIIINGLSLDTANKLKEKIVSRVPLGSLKDEVDPYWKIQLGDGETVHVANFM